MSTKCCKFAKNTRFQTSSSLKSNACLLEQQTEEVHHTNYNNKGNQLQSPRIPTPQFFSQQNHKRTSLSCCCPHKDAIHNQSTHYLFSFPALTHIHSFPSQWRIQQPLILSVPLSPTQSML